MGVFPGALNAARFLAVGVMATTAFAAAEDSRFPDVVDVAVRAEKAGGFSFDVTVSSPYDTPSRYADAWRVRSPAGDEYGVRILWHDHQDEQPFTRSLSGVRIPPGIDRVIVQARDKRNGWGGRTVEVRLPGR